MMGIGHYTEVQNENTLRLQFSTLFCAETWSEVSLREKMAIKSVVIAHLGAAVIPMAAENWSR